MPPVALAAGAPAAGVAPAAGAGPPGPVGPGAVVGTGAAAGLASWVGAGAVVGGGGVDWQAASRAGRVARPAKPNTKRRRDARIDFLLRLADSRPVQHTTCNVRQQGEQ